MSLLESSADLERHFTVSGYVIDRRAKQMLLVWHRKLARWMPPGGHLEAGELPHEAALREIREEVGLDVRPLEYRALDLGLTGERDVQIPAPLTLSYQDIPAVGEVDEHIHLDMLYLFEADCGAEVAIAKAEVDRAHWFDYADIATLAETFDSTRAVAEFVSHWERE